MFLKQLRYFHSSLLINDLILLFSGHVSNRNNLSHRIGQRARMIGQPFVQFLSCEESYQYCCFEIEINLIVDA
jgi:hypothetical protein